ncbi:hypothetical protein [Catellatospora sp. TT07R-123]|uniref:hypothetical protein n=1 Tax=Catellatospora sp. TT07R-123 TaxID=2733863 RepID=UPI001BB375F3|nr:hypothetical protein [Catellatospora sp. TT07R-123]
MTVLRLVGDGNDLSAAELAGQRLTGRALASRRLVTVSRKGGGWSAVITDAGRHYLQHGGYPNRPVGKDPELKGNPLKEAGDLIRRLQEAPDRILRIEAPDAASRRTFRRAIHAAQSNSLVPDGYQLQHTGRDHGDIVIRLADTAQSDDTAWNRIRLNARHQIRHPEQIAAALRSQTGWCLVTEPAREDAVTLALCLVDEARRAGHEVELNTKGRNPRLMLTMHGITRPLHISEEYDKVPHQPTAEEIRDNRRNPSINKIPEFDSVPSGRIRILMQRSYDKREEWTGLRPQTFRARVRQLLDDIETADAEDRKRREEQRRENEQQMEKWQRQEDDKRRRWETAIVSARRKAVAKIRQDTFRSAFDAWTRAQELRRFCTELQQLADSGTGAGDLVKWIAWGNAEAERIDPTVEPSSLAGVRFDVDPGPDDLRAFLEGWSPHRPDKEYRSGNLPNDPRESYQNPWHPGLAGKKQWWRQ